MRCKYETGDLVAKTATPKSYEYLIEANGAMFNSEQYPELALIYPSLVLPDMRARVLQGAADGENECEYKEVGLPNITGRIGEGLRDNTSSYNSYASSIVTMTGESASSCDGGPDAWNRYINFDASKANPIYGASDTVQPPAMLVKYYVCYA